MAAHSGLSERSFLRRFRRASERTTVERIQTLRVEEAKQMLGTTGMAIEEIEVGYTETSSFWNAFRGHVGRSASAYRRKHATVAPMPAGPLHAIPGMIRAVDVHAGSEQSARPEVDRHGVKDDAARV